MSVSRWNADFRAKALGRSLLKADDLQLAEFLLAKAREFRSQAGSGGSTCTRAAAKRQSRRHRSVFLKRLQVRSGNRKRRVVRGVEALLYRPKPDPVRDGLYPNFLTDWVPMQRRRGRPGGEVDLAQFSFARDPKRTLGLLAEIARAAARYPDLRINFSDTECDDVTPYIVFAHLRGALPPIVSGGTIRHQISEVVDAVGLRSPLKIGTIVKKKSSDYSVSAFRMVKRTPPGFFGDEDHLLRPQMKEYVADRFVNTVNGWLRDTDLELTEEAEGSFVRAIGEALDNAERHGDALADGGEGDWSIAGFSRLMFENDEPVLQCSVGIVSVGASISESLVSAAPDVKRAIDNYVSRHTPLFRARHTAESLRTVMALQDGITRVEEASRSGRGGVGLMELIEVFAELGDNSLPHRQSVFTVISGKTCIRVTPPFAKGEAKGGGLRQQWFNGANTDSLSPSEDHVMALDEAFPGVILSACFTIDPDYLRRKIVPESADD